MTFTLEDWKQEIEPNGRLFAELLKDDRTISIKHGFAAASLLWSIREPGKRSALGEILFDYSGKEAVLNAIEEWVDVTPQVAAMSLSRKAVDDRVLQVALESLIAFFLDELLRFGMLQPSQQMDISVDGDVSGGIVNVGGVQYFAGTVMIQQVTENTYPATSREDYAASVVVRLREQGFSVKKKVKWQGRHFQTVATGRIGSLKYLCWVMLVDFESLRLPELERYSAACQQYTVKQKTLMQKLENNFVAPVAVVDHLEQGTVDAVRASPPKIHLFGGVEMPIVAELATGTLYYSIKTPFHAQAYLPYLREEIARIMAF